MSNNQKMNVLFKALGDTRRREILDLVSQRPRTTGDLCAHFGSALDRCTVMQHLGVLQKARLLVAKREGRLRWNHFNPAPLREIHGGWLAARMKARAKAKAP